MSFFLWYGIGVVGAGSIYVYDQVEARKLRPPTGMDITIGFFAAFGGPFMATLAAAAIVSSIVARSRKSK